MLRKVLQKGQNPFAFAKTGTTVLLSDIVSSKPQFPAIPGLSESHSCTAFRALTAAGGESWTHADDWFSSERSARAKTGWIDRKTFGPGRHRPSSPIFGGSLKRGCAPSPVSRRRCLFLNERPVSLAGAQVIEQSRPARVLMHAHEIVIAAGPDRVG